MSYDKQVVDPRNISLARKPQRVQFTRFTGPEKAILTKQFSIATDGEIEKRSQPQFAGGHAETIEIERLQDIENVIGELAVNQCLATGVLDAPTCDIVCEDELTPDLQKQGVRTRTKKHMAQPETGLILLDHDPSPFMPKLLRCDSPSMLMEKFAIAVPEFDQIAYSGTSSCSSGICKAETGEKYSESDGLHIYLSAKNICLDELRRYLEAKLWNAGLGYIAFARNGAMLPRTIIDLSVLSPERLIYEAIPILGDGLVKEERKWTHRDGAFLSGPLALTDAEFAEFEQRVKAAKSDPEIIAQAEALQDAYYAVRTEKIATARGISQREARRLIARQSLQDRESTERTLEGCDVVEIGQETLTVAELLARGDEFDRKAMPDPVEGRSYGSTTAKFFYNNGQSPCIHSFAHGSNVTYRLPETDNFRIYKTDTVPATPEPLSPDSFPHVRRSSSGQIKIPTTIENVRHLIASYGGTVRYDVIKKKLNIQLPAVSGSVDNYDNAAMSRIMSLAALNGLSVTQIPEFVAVIGDENPINPVADWIMSKPWDGVDRVEAVCATLQTRDGFDVVLKIALIYRWLLSAVAAALSSSGFHARGVLTLQGLQGIGKTTWIMRLIIDPFLRAMVILLGHHLDPSSKDSVITAVSHWIVEIGELDSSFKKDIARLKGFLSNGSDRLRRPYARTDSEYQRRTVFCATVNEEHFLVDTTGNSRWWTLPLVKIDYEHDIDMQQVFAQLAVDLQNGAQWWLTRDEEALLDQYNRDHRSISAIEERVLENMDPTMPEEKWVNRSATEVLQATGIRNPTNPQTRECGKVLREHYGQPKKIRGVMKWRVPLPQDQFTRV